MKAKDIINALIEMADDRDFSETCDTFKYGNPDCEVNKTAVAMFATPEVIRKASEWGAQLLIVHEPLFYSNSDEPSDSETEIKKRMLIEKSGLVIFRYHDYAHFSTPDFIVEGVLKKLDFKGKTEYADSVDLGKVYLDEPITPVELANYIKEKCGLKNIRISGALNEKCSKISLVPGWFDVAFKELLKKETEIVITGETNECFVAEYARDSYQLGIKKALITLGHIGSERDGMIYITDILSDIFPEIVFKYFECGEVFE